MPEATFIFADSDGQLFAILPDAVTREDHAIAARATEQEVDEGIATSDHVRDEADRFGCEIVISDTPIRSIQGANHFSFGVSGELRPLALEGRSGAALSRLASAGPPARGVELTTGAVTLPSDVNTFQPDSEEVTRTVDNWTLLRAAKSGAWLATITTDTYTYRNMLLLSAEHTKTAADGKWIRVECLFRELRKAATRLVAAAEPLRPRDEAQANDGSQATDEEESEEIVSFGSQLRDAFGL